MYLKETPTRILDSHLLQHFDRNFRHDGHLWRNPVWGGTPVDGLFPYRVLIGPMCYDIPDETAKLYCIVLQFGVPHRSITNPSFYER